MRRGLVLAGVLLVVGACSSEAVTPFAIIASSQAGIGVGEQRIMFALIDQETNEYLASPDHPATVTLRDQNGAPIETYPTEFMWTVEDVRGLYVARMMIPEAATYQVTLDAEGFDTAGPMGLVAVDDPGVIERGDTAPASETRISADYPDLAEISSDPDPDPAMYEVSVAQAVMSGDPVVIVFATPGFCASATCGPILDQVKNLRESYPGVAFIHVEIYEDLTVTDQSQLTAVPAVSEWGLPSEPWVFVVDSSGTVTASFEGAVRDEELSSAIDAVAP
ncbi:MAG: thioredoxin family protein [Acidimicrobiia bacterium]